MAGMEELKIDAINKIISVDAITKILDAIDGADHALKDIADKESAQNEPLLFSKQSFTTESYSFFFSATVKLKNDSEINYRAVRELALFLKTRAFEVRTIYIYAHFTYRERQPERDSIGHSEEIDFVIREDTFGVKYTVNNSAAVNEAIKVIEQTVDEAPEKMNDAMNDQALTTAKVGLGAGLIPGMLLSCVGFILPQFRVMCGQIPGFFFLVSLVLGATTGILLAARMLEPLYRSIVGKQKYDGYNKKTRQGSYSNDMETYSSTSEVLIGDRVGSMQTRKKLSDYQKRFGRLILPELAVVLIVSAVVYAVFHFIITG